MTYYYRSGGRAELPWPVYAVAFAVVGFISLPSVFHAFSSENAPMRMTVEEKESVARGKKSGEYRIYGVLENGCRYEITNQDSHVKGKYNSARIQGATKEGVTYDFNTYGYRTYFFSHMRNVLKSPTRAYGVGPFKALEPQPALCDEDIPAQKAAQEDKKNKTTKGRRSRLHKPG